MSLVSCDGEETFSDDEAAEIMNSKFINIKVDRERPDVDELYEIIILMTGSGYINEYNCTPRWISYLGRDIPA